MSGEFPPTSTIEAQRSLVDTLASPTSPMQPEPLRVQPQSKAIYSEHFHAPRVRLPPIVSRLAKDHHVTKSSTGNTMLSHKTALLQAKMSQLLDLAENASSTPDRPSANPWKSSKKPWQQPATPESTSEPKIEQKTEVVVAPTIAPPVKARRAGPLNESAIPKSDLQSHAKAVPCSHIESTKRRTNLRNHQGTVSQGAPPSTSLPTGFRFRPSTFAVRSTNEPESVPDNKKNDDKIIK